MTWLENLMESTKESEAPRRYFYWAGIATLSAIAKSNVYLDRYNYILYPNIYTLIIGRSGLRKGIPVKLAKDLISTTNNTKIISGRNSIEGLMKDLSQGYTLHDGTVMKDAIGAMISGEFAVFLIKNPEALTILTDLYDGQYNPEFKNTLKNSPIEILKNPCLTLIGASNETHFKVCVPANAIGGGFIARTFLVVEYNKNSVNALVRKPKFSINELPTELCKHLKEVAKLKGKFKYSSEAADYYEKWYNNFSKVKVNDQTGTLERIHDGILKVAMLISLSRKLDLTIEKSDIEESMDRCRECTEGTNRLVMGSGGISDQATSTAILLNELIESESRQVCRQEFLHKHWKDVDSQTLDRVVETLENARAITTKRIGTSTYYKMSDKTYKDYIGYASGKGEDN